MPVRAPRRKTFQGEIKPLVPRRLTNIEKFLHPPRGGPPPKEVPGRKKKKKKRKTKITNLRNVQTFILAIWSTA